MSDIKRPIALPESIILETINQGLKAVRQDYIQATDKNKTFLYRVLGNTALERYDSVRQAASIFVTPENRAEPKHVSASMGFDVDKVKDPNIHVIMQNESPANDGLGFDEGIKQEFDDIEGKYVDFYTRGFQSDCNLLITATNSNEAMIIYYVLRALLISLKETLEGLGFQNLKWSGAGVRLEQQIKDKLFMRSLFLKFEYDTDVPQLENRDLIGKIILGDLTFDREILVTEGETDLKTVADYTGEELLVLMTEQQKIDTGATAIVNDQNGTELARRDIASGATDTIVVQAGAQEYSVIIDFDQSNSLLEYTIIAGSDQAADYINETLTNVATVVYTVNGVNTSLPFSLVSGDNLTVTITRTDDSLDSTVKISNV